MYILRFERQKYFQDLVLGSDLLELFLLNFFIFNFGAEHNV